MNLKNPKVSWLLCTNSYTDLTERAIRSCLDQTYIDFELVIVTNGPNAVSIQNSIRNFCKDLAHVRVYSTDISMLNFSLSYGLHLCRGEFIARMDADDISLPDRLERQVSYLDVHKDVTVVSSSYYLVDEFGNTLDIVECPSSNKNIRRSLFYGNPICHPSVMFRRADVVAIGGYLSGKYSEDYDLWVRLASDSKVIFYSFNDPLIKYNVSNEGQARGSKFAYVNVGSIQIGRFFICGDPRWLIGACLSFLKALFYSKSKL